MTSKAAIRLPLSPWVADLAWRGRWRLKPHCSIGADGEVWSGEPTGGVVRSTYGLLSFRIGPGAELLVSREANTSAKLPPAVQGFLRQVSLEDRRSVRLGGARR